MSVAAFEVRRSGAHSGGNAVAPVVLLHGFLGAPSGWADVLDRLANVTGDIALATLPGHGVDPWYPSANERSFEGAVDALAPALPFPSASVVGYSMGGRLALGLAARHPARVRSLVLVAASPGLAPDATESIEAPDATEDARASRRAWDDTWAARAEREGVESLVDAWEALPMFASQRRLPLDERSAIRDRRIRHTREGVAWAMRAMGTGSMPSLWGALPSCAIPVHLVVGADDPKFLAIARAMARTLPRASLRVVGDVGHDVVAEAPDAVAEAIRESLDAIRHAETTYPRPALATCGAPGPAPIATIPLLPPLRGSFP